MWLQHTHAKSTEEPVDPMDAYLRDSPDPPQQKELAGFTASESIESPSRKLQHPDSVETDGDGALPFGTRLKPPRHYGAVVSLPPIPSPPTKPLLPTSVPKRASLSRSPERLHVPATIVRGPDKRPSLDQTTPQHRTPLVIDTRRRRKPQVKTSLQPPRVGQLERKPGPLERKPVPPLNATLIFRKHNLTKLQVARNTTPGNPKPQASFFFTNVGPNHFEYRGVFDQNAVPISFRDNPETLLQLIPQLPRLFDDPFTPPKEPPAQLLLQPPPKLLDPPPPPLTLLQPVLNFVEPPQQPFPPERQLFPKYDYIRGPQYPKIFKFNDERISIVEFERSKREGHFPKRRNDPLDPDRVARSNFLIFHGGLFNLHRRQQGGGNPTLPRSEPLYAPYKTYAPDAQQLEFLPVKPTFGKNKPGGFVYFIRT